MDISNDVKNILHDLESEFAQCDPDSLEDKQHLAAQIINYASRKDIIASDNIRDVINVLIDAEIYNAWDEFYMCYLSSKDKIAQDSELYFNTIYAPSNNGKMDYYLYNVTQMNELFNDPNAGIKASHKHAAIVRSGFDGMWYGIQRNFRSGIFADLAYNKQAFINIITAACNLSNIDPVEFLKNFGYQDSSINNADQATIAKYLKVIQALNMDQPSKCENGLSSLAWRKAMSYLDGFKYGDIFTADGKLRGAIQKQCQTSISKVWVYNNDPNLLLINTYGYNFLTTREIINKDLGLNI